MGDSYEYIYSIGFILLVILIIALLGKKPIEEIRNGDNRVIIAIYQTKFNKFLVMDKLTKRKIHFSTFKDVEAYVLHRLNRWDMHEALSKSRKQKVYTEENQ